MKAIISFLQKIIALEHISVHIVRIAIAIVLIWIGGLKFVSYEADGITPFVANSPFMSFFYNHPEEYKTHKNPEGKLVSENRTWHIENNTYGFSYGLGTLLVTMGVFLLLFYIHPLFGIIGGLLVFIMSIGTLTFLITTPEVWVMRPALGEGAGNYGFPYLAGAGRLVLKDIIMLGGAWVVTIDAAKKFLARCANKKCC